MYKITQTHDKSKEYMMILVNLQADRIKILEDRIRILEDIIKIHEDRIKE